MIPFKLVYEPLPDFIRYRVHGMTMIRNGRCMIIIERDIDEQAQRHYLKHEFAHIVLGHFGDSRTETANSYLLNLAEIEDEAERYADQMSDEEFSRLMQYQV